MNDEDNVPPHLGTYCSLKQGSGGWDTLEPAKDLGQDFRDVIAMSNQDRLNPEAEAEIARLFDEYMNGDIDDGTKIFDCTQILRAAMRWAYRDAKEAVEEVYEHSWMNGYDEERAVDACVENIEKRWMFDGRDEEDR